MKYPAGKGMKIGLLGHGVVGSGVSKIIDGKLTPETTKLEVTRILVKDESEVTDCRMTTDYLDVVTDPEIDIVAECMGGIEPAHTFVKTALEHGKHVVTSNKKMLATFAEDLLDTAKANNVKICYEASVGGGIPWMAELGRIRRIDEVSSFEGIFNGTTNYILSRMYNEGKDFDEMLKEAQALGYAERNPADDIDGDDVRYKTALSALAAFDEYVVPGDIPTFGIRYITKKDMDWAKSRDCGIKLVGKGVNKEGSMELSVMPVFVKKDTVFANIPLNFNAIQSDSATLGKAVFVGQGAGSLPTAHAVVQDLIDINTDRTNIHPGKHTKSVSAQQCAVYYIRCEKLSHFEDLLDERIDETTALTKKIALQDLVDRVGSYGEEDLFVAEVNHD